MRNRQPNFGADDDPDESPNANRLQRRLKRTKRAGRHVGSTKASRELVEKLRKRGKTNKEIATELGISARTVTRYLGLSGSRRLSLAKTFASINSQQVKSLFGIQFSKLSELNSYDRQMAIFVLRLINNPQWERAWNSASLGDRLKAIVIKRLFSEFLEICRMRLEDLNEHFPNMTEDVIHAKAKSDFDVVDALWDALTPLQ